MNRIIPALIAILFLLPGCATVQEVFDTVSGYIAGMINSSDTEAPSAEKTQVTGETPIRQPDRQPASTAPPQSRQATPLPQAARQPAQTQRPALWYIIPLSYDTAYSYRTDKPDPLMVKMPQNIEALRANNPTEYVKQTAEYINSKSTDNFQRVKKAHDLTALLIRYDAASYWANTIPDQSFQNVLKTRLAVCEGYANLFKRLCDELKIPCEVVHGYGRGVGSSPDAVERPYNSNHAWNIVAINGEHYLVDATWNSGFMDGRVSKQSYTTDYLFLKPEHFIHDHFPTNSNHQLLKTPLSAAQFSSLPFLKPKFFEFVQDISVNLRKKMYVDNGLVFDFSAKDGYHISFNMYDIAGGKEFRNNTFIGNNGSGNTAYFSFPEAGQYLVRIFWMKNGTRQGSGCGEFIAEASSASAVLYPTTYTSSVKNLRIISPLEMPLEREKTYTFQVSADNRSVAALIYGRTFVQMTKNQDGVFTIEFTVPLNISELSMAMANSVTGSYQTVAKYLVR
ncbi:MAG: hypothetical protein FWF29_04035 [Treponema sp.]|nr:hypothetical protein [Treponema sp.]